jgi:hypothetical protein
MERHRVHGRSLPGPRTDGRVRPPESIEILTAVERGYLRVTDSLGFREGRVLYPPSPARFAQVSLPTFPLNQGTPRRGSPLPADR